MVRSGGWQTDWAAPPVPKTLPKQGFSDILWLRAGTARIGHNGFPGQLLRPFLGKRLGEEGCSGSPSQMLGAAGVKG